MTKCFEVEIAGGTILLDAEGVEKTRNLTMYVSTNGYAYYSIWSNGRSRPYTVHGHLLNAPRGMHVDHINGDKLDNRLENLRIVSPQTNQVNRKLPNRNNTSGIRGVVRSQSARNPWKAQIMVNGKMIYLGSFPTIEAAAEARRLAEIEHYGEECPR